MTTFSGCMDQNAVAKINSNMKAALFLGTFKKDKISDLQLVFFYKLAAGKLGFAIPWDNNPCFFIGVTGQAAAVKSCFRRLAAPFIWNANALDGIMGDNFSLL